MLHRGAQGVGVGAGQVVGVRPRRQFEHREPQVVGGLPGVDALRGGLAGLVRVVGQHDVAGEPLEDPHVVLGESRPARGDRSRDAGTGEADHVGVALAHDDLIGGDRIGLGPVDGVQRLGLVVEDVVTRVLVLRSVGVGQLPSAEADHPVALVEDREQDPAAEEVLQAVATVEEPEAGRLEVVVGGLQRADQLVPVVGRPPDAVAGHLVGVEAPGPEIGPRRRRIRSGAQPLVVPLAGLLGEGEQAVLALAPFGLVALGVAQRDAGLGRQPLHRTREVEVLDLADEGDGVAGGLASEAVVEPLGLVDREAGRLLVVERAQAGPPLADPLELRVARDDRDEVRRLPDPCDVLVDDPHGRRLQAPPDSPSGPTQPSFSARYASTSASATRSWSIESRSRTVTERSSRVSKS